MQRLCSALPCSCFLDREDQVNLIPVGTNAGGIILLMRRLELAGEKFGRLLVIEQAGKKDGRLLWRCECECGDEVTLPGYKLTQNYNPVKSCGCLRGGKVTHGHTKNKRHTSEYRTWRYVIEDCDYQPWATDFERFLSDVGERPSPRLVYESLHPFTQTLIKRHESNGCLN